MCRQRRERDPLCAGKDRWRVYLSRGWELPGQESQRSREPSDTDDPGDFDPDRAIGAKRGTTPTHLPSTMPPYLRDTAPETRRPQQPSLPGLRRPGDVGPAWVPRIFDHVRSPVFVRLFERTGLRREDICGDRPAIGSQHEDPATSRQQRRIGDSPGCVATHAVP